MGESAVQLETAPTEAPQAEKSPRRKMPWHLLTHPHDSKTYMHFGLCCTPNVACLLWWFRTNRRIAWLGWIAAGVAMGGLQALGLILLAIEPLLLIAQPRAHWKRTLQFLIGISIIAAGPLGYYL